MKKAIFLMTMMITSQVFAQLPNFKPTVKELTQTCNDALAKVKKDIDTIATSKDEATFENTVVATDNALAEFDKTAGILAFLENVAPDALLRAASTDCEVLITKAAVDIFSREDLFIKFQSVKNSRQGRKLEGADKKLLNDFYSSFIENGVSVADKEKRKKIQDISKQISEHQSEFSKNVRDDKRFIQVDKSELAGLSGDWIEHLEKAKNGKYIVTTQYPDYNPFMKNAKSENARKRLYEQFNIRGGKRNIQILEKTLALRHELAVLLGFANHADQVFALQGRMATSTKQVYSFLGNLADALVPYLDRDLSEIRRLKCKDTKCKDWDDVTINPWDLPYYINQMEKNVGNIDQEEVKKYFPLETVIRGMFEIYQNLLSVNFEKLQNISVWDPSVEVYEVRDKSSHELLGTFYLDLYPRNGKYGHAAVWSLIKPKAIEKGYQKTVVAMVCNFPRPTTELPTLLHHSEVETFFHEFGHVMDAIISRTKYYNHGGEAIVQSIYSTRSGSPRDFVEAPSQMLENWVWNPTSLALLSGHYKTGEKLPKEMLDKMMALKDVANGYVNTRQLFLATVDLDYHTAIPPVNSSQIWNTKSKTMSKITPVETVYPQASFEHIMGGYDSGYYGYMWSKVYAEDMFSVFEKNGVLDAKTGMKYRKLVYEPSGSQSPFTSIKNFLGRDANQDAFLKSLGIKVDDKTKTAK